ncbi:MAG: chitobiase/beta-hexosaminidase C-terminal domain-containing protein [Bacteroidaceae bacterium]|nr:chitobiase/beta-hexosaminidase C-terminal domain-containing protein [Bacteroidaceae bacterium]
MIELYLSKNNLEGSAAYGKYYPRVSYKQTLNIHDMAKHMAEHNTPFSEGTIEGILRDFVKCTREQTLMGNTVKVDDLAIFKVSVIGNGCAKLYDPDTDKTISASIGTIGKNDKTGAAVQSLKLLAQATGEYTRDELNKVAKLAWTDKAAAEIAAAKAAALGGGGSNGGGSEQNGGSEQQSESVMAPEISGTSPFTDTTQVTIQGPQGAEVRYTTDGSDPSAESTLYSEAITLSATTTIKAIAILDGETSAVASKTFTKSGESGGFDLGN